MPARRSHAYLPHIRTGSERKQTDTGMKGVGEVSRLGILKRKLGSAADGLSVHRECFLYRSIVLPVFSLV